MGYGITTLPINMRNSGVLQTLYAVWYDMRRMTNGRGYRCATACVSMPNTGSGLLPRVSAAMKMIAVRTNGYKPNWVAMRRKWSARGSPLNTTLPHPVRSVSVTGC